MPIVPVGRVVLLAPWEGVYLKVWVQLIPGREMLHLSDSVLIHPIKSIIYPSPPGVHLTHPSTLVSLPIPWAHMPVIVSSTGLISPLRLLLLQRLILLLIAPLTSSPTIVEPNVCPVLHLHDDIHLLQGPHLHHPATNTTAQISHDLVSKDPVGPGQSGNKHPAIDPITLSLSNPTVQEVGDPERDVAECISRVDGEEEEDVSRGDPVVRAVSPRQGVGDTPMDQPNPRVPDLGCCRGRGIHTIPYGGPKRSASELIPHGLTLC